jgi:release factor glutamine methyltransferase
VTIREALAAAARELAAAGCDTPDLDAQVLLAHALGGDRATLVTRAEAPVPTEAEAEFGRLMRRRAAREPVAYLTRRRGFRHIELQVDRRVLIPRPDTETLVDVALGVARGARVHDVGTGSGAVALALKFERPDLQVSASDASADALDVARANAQRLALDVAFERARDLPDGDYDLVVANLPYVREDEWNDLMPEIRLFEPREALVSGADGLDAIRALAAAAPTGTSLALEHAPDQGAAVRELLSGAGTVQDLAGRDRVTTGSAP